MFNADLALSVTMTAIGTLVSSIMLPANLMLYVNAAFKDKESTGEESVIDSIDWVSLFTSLAIVIAAIGLGLFASYKVSSPKFNVHANRLGSISGILLVVFSLLLSSFSGDEDAKVWSQHWTFYLGVSLPCLAGLVISIVLSAHIAKLKKPEVVSVGVECCYQNVGIAQSGKNKYASTHHY
jgi:predicted Na+-dependent transporter